MSSFVWIARHDESVFHYFGYSGEFRVSVMMNDARTTKWNHITRLACSIRERSSFPAFPNQTLCCEFAYPYTPWRCETPMTNPFPSELPVNSQGANEQKIKLHSALFGPWQWKPVLKERKEKNSLLRILLNHDTHLMWESIPATIIPPGKPGGKHRAFDKIGQILVPASNFC